VKIFKSAEIRRKIFFTLLIVVVFRLLAHVPTPGVDVSSIKEFLQSSALLGMFNLFSGGGFQNFSIVTLGLGPYINVSIIIQLLTVMIPSLEELSKEGEIGRERINSYTKLFSIPMAFLQSFGIYFLLTRQGIISHLLPFDLLVLIFSLTAGSMILIWIGDLVTEYGVGNGISLLIFIGIISSLPSYLVSLITSIDQSNIILYFIYTIIAILVICGIVLINEGTRNINIEYGRIGTTSQKVVNYLPLKINQAGVIPIIFAVSIIMLPSIISAPLIQSKNFYLEWFGKVLAQNFSTLSLVYNITFFLLVLGFTYFYTYVQFNPQKIADDIKKRGGFIPGIRPGANTTKYLSSVVSKTTFAGGVFLGLIAILPYLLYLILGSSMMSIGGTSLLIVVSVVLETIRQIKSMFVNKNYDNYLN